MIIPTEVCRKGVMLCVAAATLSWAAQPGISQTSAALFQSPQYTVLRDRVIEGPYSAVALSPDEIDSNYPAHSGASQQTKRVIHSDLTAYPQFHSDSVLLDSVYNMSLEELTEDISKQGTFDAGALWPGPWTRDVSYSILLSLAIVDPDLAKATLLRKVNRDRIVQDTGTGGSWPVSSDRECWAIAAWEIYRVTGDRAWLQKSATIIKNSIADDEEVVLDGASGLAHGETSFMDWREQTYPRWMQPVDIYDSEALSTNAIFYRVFRILGAMDRERGGDSGEWDQKAQRIQSSVNELFWRREAGLYGEYRYGRMWPSLCPRTDALGEALAILFDLASPAQQQSILKAQPLMPYGVPTVYPETPDVPPYHNNSVWPFVQAFYNLAAAKDGNEALLAYGLGSMYRASALFLTNKENFVAETGSPLGTVLNSDRQLWSVSGGLAMVYRVFFGMRFSPAGLILAPVIPQSFEGTYELSNLHYRGVVLSVRVHGFGDGVGTMRLDGLVTHGPVPATLRGNHRIEIEMNGRGSSSNLPNRMITTAEEATAPDTPALSVSSGSLVWPAIQGAAEYQLYRNGPREGVRAESDSSVADVPPADELQVAADGFSGLQSFLSEPVHSGTATLLFPVVPASTKPEASAAFITLEQTGTTGLRVTAKVAVSGAYSIRFRYANGSGPVNTNSKCAIRTLFVDGRRAGPIILPQRGEGAWDIWGESSSQVMKLAAGTHVFELRFLPSDLNMNGTINRAKIASLDVTQMGDVSAGP
jgi:hypothetical protein